MVFRSEKVIIKKYILMLINFYKTSTFSLSVALVVSSVSALSLEESSSTTFVQTANDLDTNYTD